MAGKHRKDAGRHREPPAPANRAQELGRMDRIGLMAELAMVDPSRASHAGSMTRDQIIAAILLAESE